MGNSRPLISRAVVGESCITLQYKITILVPFSQIYNPVKFIYRSHVAGLGLCTKTIHLSLNLLDIFKFTPLLHCVLMLINVILTLNNS